MNNIKFFGDEKIRAQGQKDKPGIEEKIIIIDIILNQKTTRIFI